MIFGNTDLLDPDKLAGDKYDFYNDKIRNMKALLSRSPAKGGFPFFYFFTMGKNQVLKEIKIPFYTDPTTGETTKIGTAATDGRNFYWDPQVLEENDPFTLTYFLVHEAYHQIFQHCDPDRNYGKNKFAWAAAIDYIVWSNTEACVRESGRLDLPRYNLNSSKQYPDNQHPIFSPTFGGQLSLNELCKSLKDRKKNKNQGMTPPSSNVLKKPTMKDAKIYVDFDCYNKSAEDVYREIMKCMDQDFENQTNGPNGGAGLNPGQWGLAGDDHMDSQLTDQELLSEVMEAATATERQAGTTPGAIKEMLKELLEPKLTWQDIVRNAINFMRQEKGSKNDWSRFRRRHLANGIYSPRRKEESIKFLAVIDTSGSMSDSDMVYGISQLKALDSRSKGIIMSNDAVPYWDTAVDIYSAQDLKNTQIKGRGGTGFADFFNNFEEKLGKDFDIIIIMTDLEIYDISQCKRPRQDVVWISVNENYKGQNVPFGRLAPMHKHQ